MTVEFWITIGFSTFTWAVLWSVNRWIMPRFHKPDGISEAREAELRETIRDLERRLADTERENKELKNQQGYLWQQIKENGLEMETQKKEIVKLTDKVRELERSNPVVPNNAKPVVGRVLAVWPTPVPQEIANEKSAITNMGLAYEALEGAAATRMGILAQLAQRSDYKIMEIGAKGGPSGIQLADGMTPPSWWLGIAKSHNIEIFLVLANESSKPGVLNVADALFRADHVRAVISVDSTISDKDAQDFKNLFYQRYSAGVPLAQAVEFARLVISDAGSDAIKLRER